MTDKPVVAVAKERRGDADEGGIVTLSSGVRVRLKSVSPSLIDEAMARVLDPEVPMWTDPEKDREVPNPNNPAYLRACAAADRARGRASTDALIMFGVELEDGVPKDGAWLKKLQKLGHDIDPKDPIDVEFAYKKYIAVQLEDYPLLGRRSGIRGEDVDAQAKSFQREGEGDADSGSELPEST